MKSDITKGLASCRGSVETPVQYKMYNHGTASAYTSLLDNSIFEAHCSKERGPRMESPITILLFELHFKHGRWCSAPSFRQKIYRIRLLILLLFCVVYGQARCNDFLFHLIDNWVSTISNYREFKISKKEKNIQNVDIC